MKTLTLVHRDLACGYRATNTRAPMGRKSCVGMHLRAKKPHARELICCHAIRTELQRPPNADPVSRETTDRLCRRCGHGSSKRDSGLPIPKFRRPLQSQPNIQEHPIGGSARATDGLWQGLSPHRRPDNRGHRALAGAPWRRFDCCQELPTLAARGR